MDSDTLVGLIPSSMDTDHDDEGTNEQEQKIVEARRKAAIKNINAIEILILNIIERLNDDSQDSHKIINDSRPQMCKILGCNENVDIFPPFSIVRSSLLSDHSNHYNDDIIACGLD